MTARIRAAAASSSTCSRRKRSCSAAGAACGAALACARGRRPRVSWCQPGAGRRRLEAAVHATVAALRARPPGSAIPPAAPGRDLPGRPA